MILNCICARIKSIFLAFLSVFKRALCMVNRRRPSDCNFEPLETISIVRNHNYPNSSKVSVYFFIYFFYVFIVKLTIYFIHNFILFIGKRLEHLGWHPEDCGRTYWKVPREISKTSNSDWKSTGTWFLRDRRTCSENYQTGKDPYRN